MEKKVITSKVDQVKPFWSSPPHKRELKVLLSPKVHGTSPQLSIGMVSIPPGESGDPHFHDTEQETWFVISGTGKLVVGEEEVKLEADMVVVAPAGVPHQIINDGSQVLKALFIFTPAGPEEPFIVE
jgi:mannose-6-phosphate isomerase-like protein (cupin superfamily)